MTSGSPRRGAGSNCKLGVKITEVNTDVHQCYIKDKSTHHIGDPLLSFPISIVIAQDILQDQVLHIKKHKVN